MPRTFTLVCTAIVCAVTATTSAAEMSPGQKELQEARSQGQHLFILFSRKNDAATQTMRQTLTTETAKHPEQRRLLEIAVTNPQEKVLIDQWQLSRAPMPLTLAIAPNRAVTGGFPLRVTAEQLDKAIVSKGTAACLLAAQTKKLALLCVHHDPAMEVPGGVADFLKDPAYGMSTEVVSINSDDPAEQEFLKSLKLTSHATTTTALIAPPGTVLASYPTSVTKDQIVATLKTAQSSCCPGGKCGPNGCQPAKTAAKN